MFTNIGIANRFDITRTFIHTTIKKYVANHISKYSDIYYIFGGGWGYYTDSIFAKNNSSDGGGGVWRYPINMTSENWDKSYVTSETGGAGGAGGINISDGGATGGGGEPGYAVIVWLYS